MEAVATAIAAAAAQPDPIGDQDRAERDVKAQETMARWAGPLFYAALASVVLGVVGVILIALTLWETFKAAGFAAETLDQAKLATQAANRTTAETRRIGEAQVRAYVSVKEVAARVQPGGLAGDEVHIHFAVHNTGQSPVMDVKIFIAAWLSGVERSTALIRMADIGAGQFDEDEVAVGRFPFKSDRQPNDVSVKIAVEGRDVFGGKALCLITCSGGWYSEVDRSAAIPLRRFGAVTGREKIKEIARIKRDAMRAERADRRRHEAILAAISPEDV